MSRIAPLAALIVVACLAAARAPSHCRRPTRRAEATPCLLKLVVTRPFVPAASSAPAEAPGARGTDEPAALASLASIVQATSLDDEALVAELVSLSRRLLQGDATLASTTLAQVDGSASPPRLRNMCLLLLAFTEEPRARETLRAKALAADDDRASLALEAVMEFREVKADGPDFDLEGYWVEMFLKHPAALLPPDTDPWTLEIRALFNRREIRLAPPAEGEEGGGGATIEEEVPGVDPGRREVLVAVAQSAASVAAREKAIAWLAQDRSAEALLRALAREEGTPNRVKSAVYAGISAERDDYDFITKEILRSNDPNYLAALCVPLLQSAGTRQEEAVALLERLAPIADTNAHLAESLMCAFGWDFSIPKVQTMERIARMAESRALRHTAVSALHPDTSDLQLAYNGERIDILQRLSWAPSAGLAAEASLALLSWRRVEPAWAKRIIDGAFLRRAGALAQMPSVPEALRKELTEALAERAKSTR